MGRKLTLAIMAITLAAALLQTTMAQELHVVGDKLGWKVPPGGPIAYETWADMQVFTVGDILMFNFTTGEQDVARVTKEAFDACNSTNPILSETAGPANFTLSSAGEYYFIGTMERHCYLGQKLAINVTGTSGPSASPAPHSPPATPRAPVTYVVGEDLGWVVPPGGKLAYATWAYDKTFMVGDTLVFNFANGTQDVAEVTKAAYESCDTNNTLTLLTTSPAKVVLATSGEHFFTSTYARHCTMGQKLAINVTSAAATAPTPSSTSTATSPSPSPTSTATSPSPSSTSTATSPSSPSLAASSPAANSPAAPPLDSSAPSNAVFSFSFVTFLSVALAFFFN